MKPRTCLYWLPTLIWLGVIFYFSSRPTAQASTFALGDFLLKKTAHFVEYFILAWLFFGSLRQTTKLRLFHLLLLTLAFTVLYAASDEFHQSFVAGRGPALRDVFIDAFGSATACKLLVRRLNKTIG